MITKEYRINSTNLDKQMTINVYGYFGFSLLLFPTITDSPNENLESGLIDSLSYYVDKGKFKIISVGSVNFESWHNPSISNEMKSERHKQYNNFLLEELVPLIFSISEGPSPIITAGAAVGAYHAANSYFRRPDLFYGTIALSGTYNLQHYTQGYFDSNCYFNSPIHYLPNLNDPYWLSFLQGKHHVYLLSGSGRDEYPDNTRHLSDILSSKDIKHHVDIWNDSCDHCFDTWINMFNHIMATKL